MPITAPQKSKTDKKPGKIAMAFGFIVVLGIPILIIAGIVSALTNHKPTQHVATVASQTKPDVSKTTAAKTTSTTPTSSPPTKAVDVAAVKASLAKGDQYALDLFDQAKAALGTYQYPDAYSGIAALESDSSSPAANWSTFNQSFDGSYAAAEKNSQLAYNEASNAYYDADVTQPSIIDDWSTINGQMYTDIMGWEEDATQWQISAIPTTKLNGDAQKIQQDLAAAKTDIAKL